MTIDFDMMVVVGVGKRGGREMATPFAKDLSFAWRTKWTSSFVTMISTEG